MVNSDAREAQIGPWPIIFGVLGLVPFWAPLTFSLTDPADAVGAATIQAIYAALILSFLGGARFGRALGQPRRAAVIALSMVPSIMSLFILALPTGDAASKLSFLMVGLALALIWDLRAPDHAQGYKWLRIALTVLAIPPMAIQAFLTWPRL